MKRIILMVITGLSVLGFQGRANAQADEIAQLLLNVEKLSQFKRILEDMKKGYEILNGGYNTVKDISEGNFSIHQTFLDGLMAVSPEVRKYRKVAAIIEQQVLLIREYRSAYNRFVSAGTFQPSELRYMERVYGNLFDKSLRNLDELAMVITAGKLRMGDDERLRTIDRIYEEMEEKLKFLRQFNNSTSILSIQREKVLKDVKTFRKTYGLPD